MPDPIPAKTMTVKQFAELQQGGHIAFADGRAFFNGRPVLLQDQLGEYPLIEWINSIADEFQELHGVDPRGDKTAVARLIENSGTKEFFLPFFMQPPESPPIHIRVRGDHIHPSPRRITEEVFAALPFAMRHRPMTSAHQGYALILQELNGLWDEVRHPVAVREKLRAQAKGLALASLQFLIEVCDDDPDGGKDA